MPTRTLDSRSCPVALENWRRVCTLWNWLGRDETGDRLLRLLARLTPKAPLKALKRAQLGDRRGSGRLRPGSARGIVGPLLGVNFDARASANAYDGPARGLVLAALRVLGPTHRLELAEHWVDYLRRECDEPPALLPPSAAGGAPVAALDSSTRLAHQLLQLTEETRALLDAYLARHPPARDA